MNKVILIGGSHHNGLGLVRSFGVNGIRPYGIIVCPLGGDSYLTHSRYWEKTYCVASDEAAVDLLYKKFSGEKEKPVVIPWSDSTEYCIDSQLDKLKEYFILPSISGKQGAIVDLMDKQKQVEFCKKNGLNMAKSVIFDLDKEIVECDISYPVVIKPVVSAEGKKSDIRKCENIDELIACANKLKECGYKRLMVQEYIDFYREIELRGSTGVEDSYLICENIREWPIFGGTNSFSRVINDVNVTEYCMKVLAAIKQIGFSGSYDVEMFLCIDGRMYVNEFNWRNSGTSYFALGTECHYVVIWYLSLCGLNTSNIVHTSTDTNQYAMNEATDLRHVVFGKLTLFKWLKDLWRTNSFALWFWRDPLPALYQYKHLALEFIKRCN